MKHSKGMRIYRNRYRQKVMVWSFWDGTFRVNVPSAMYTREAQDDSGSLVMYDYQGGPAFFVGSEFPYDESLVITGLSKRGNGLTVITKEA